MWPLPHWRNLSGNLFIHIKTYTKMDGADRMNLLQCFLICIWHSLQVMLCLAESMLITSHDFSVKTEYVPCVCSIDVLPPTFEGQTSMNRQGVVYKAIRRELQSTSRSMLVFTCYQTFIDERNSKKAKHDFLKILSSWF
jgi:hypothetical protein